MARQPEVEFWPPLKDAYKFFCLEKRKPYVNKKRKREKERRKKERKIPGTRRRRPNKADYIRA
jgi:murein L,D-transpeptidase YafK